MDRFVHTSARRLLIVSSPLILIAVVLTSLAFWRADFVLFAVMVDALAIALAAKLLPAGRPILDLTASELRYGAGLREIVRLPDIKHAAVFSSPHAWPGSVCVSLRMEARRADGQIHYDEKSFHLFCPDVSAKEIGERIHQLIEVARRR